MSDPNMDFVSAGIDIDIDYDSDDRDSTRAVVGDDDDVGVSAGKPHQMAAAAAAFSGGGDDETGASFSGVDDRVRMFLGEKSFVGDMVIVGGLVFDKLFVASHVERLGRILDAVQHQQIKAVKERRFADADRLMNDLLMALVNHNTMWHVLMQMK